MGLHEDMADKLMLDCLQRSCSDPSGGLFAREAIFPHSRIEAALHNSNHLYEWDTNERHLVIRLNNEYMSAKSSRGALHRELVAISDLDDLNSYAVVLNKLNGAVAHEQKCLTRIEHVREIYELVLSMSMFVK